MPPTLSGWHATWAWVVIGANGAAGLWALTAHWVARLRVGAVWWAVVVAQASVFVQVGLGVALMANEDVRLDGLHALYGFSTMVAVAILYAYREQLRASLYLLYGGGSLFVMGLAVRAALL